MSFFTGFAVYFIIWWLTLFMVLPFGVRTQAEDGERVLGTDPGSPTHSRLGLKLLVNTLVSGVIFLAWYWLTYHMDMGLDKLPSIFPQDR
ncbi:MAG: DUF1467 family protein [Nitratireductor sp.]|nr:DUF1467 family protein [Nitratireductor sp.]MCB1464471.1 DUF1467 family protein [Nitratireductor sp.]